MGRASITYAPGAGLSRASTASKLAGVRSCVPNRLSWLNAQSMKIQMTWIIGAVRPGQDAADVEELGQGVSALVK